MSKSSDLDLRQSEAIQDVIKLGEFEPKSRLSRCIRDVLIYKRAADAGPYQELMRIFDPIVKKRWLEFSDDPKKFRGGEEVVLHPMMSHYYSTDLSYEEWASCERRWLIRFLLMFVDHPPRSTPLALRATIWLGSFSVLCLSMLVKPIRAVRRSQTDNNLKASRQSDLPRLLRLFSFILTKKTREQIFEPAYYEFVEDHLRAKRYRKPWAKRWIKFSFAVRATLLIWQCLWAQFGNWKLKVAPWLYVFARWFY